MMHDSGMNELDLDRSTTENILEVLSFSSIYFLVILTQNVTNTVEDSITVFPGITIEITCVSNSSNSLSWNMTGSNGNSVISDSFQTAELGDFRLMLLNISGSSISSTATTVSSSTTSLTCSDSSSNSATINVYIKPVDPQSK